MNDWPEGWDSDNNPRRATGGMSDARSSDLGARRPAGAAQAGRVGNWPAQPPDSGAPGRRPPEGPSGGGWQPARRRRRFGPKRILQIVAAVVILLIVGAVAFYFYLNSKLVRVNALANYAGRPAAGAGTKWLRPGAGTPGRR